MKISLLTLLYLSIACSSMSQSLTVNSMQKLDFGTQIFPGIEKSVSRTDDNAAKYEITGEGGREVQVTFQLPDYLSDDYGNNLMISFSSTDAGYNTAELGQSTATAFDPNSGVVTSLGLDGYLYIWLGGTVTPASSQPGNTYRNDIILDVTYTN